MLTVCPEKQIILHLKFYAEYKDSAHIKKVLISFEHTVSSDGSLFTLLN